MTTERSAALRPNATASGRHDNLSNEFRPLTRAVPAALRLTGLTALLVAGSAQAVQFTETTGPAGFFYNGETRGAAWVDFNGDHRPDVHANNHRERTNLYRNNGDGTFTNVILQWDLDQKWLKLVGNDTHGASWADFDNDGDQDVFNATGSNTEPWFFVNQGTYFTEEASFRGVPDDAGGWMGTWQDYNRDSRLDLTQHRIFSSRTLRQEANNTFVSVNGTDASGSCGGTDWSHIFDFDDDGTEELFCLQNTFPVNVFETTPAPWVDITNTIPVIDSITNTAIADFDNDLRTDIFLLRGRVQPSEAVEIDPNKIEAFLTLNMDEKGFSFVSNDQITVTVDTEHHGPGRVYIGSGCVNPAAMTFTVDPTDPNVLGICPHTPGTPAGQGAYIGFDDVLDEWQIFVSPDNTANRAYVTVDTASTFTSLTSLNFGFFDGPTPPRILMNTVTGFVEESATRGLTDSLQCNSAIAQDFDNDGDVDIFAACNISVSNIANRLFLNDGAGNFTESTGFGGEGVIGAGVAAAVGASESAVTADYDIDGLMDVFVTNGARLRPTKVGGPDQMFRNTTSNDNDWIELRLVGTASNRDAYGAKVYATSGSLVQLREQHGGYHRWSQSSRVIHFGFGDLNPGGVPATPQIDSIRVEWPNGFVDEFFNVDANQLYTVTERATAIDTGSIDAVVLGPVPGTDVPVPGDECGESRFDPSQDVGIFITRDCTNDVWILETNAGGSPSNVIFEGQVESDTGFSFVDGSGTANPLETFDVLDSDPDPNVMDFKLKVKNENIDEVNFTANAGVTELCLSLVEGASQVHIGPRHLPIDLPVDLLTMTSCTPPAGSARMGDFVWDDTNADGIQDTGEPGIIGAIVNLYDCSSNLLDSTTTGSAGEYLFNNLPAGDYMLEFVLQAGFNFSPQFQGTDGGMDSDADPATGQTSCKTLSEGEVRLGIDAGMTMGTPAPTGQIGDFVWDDLNSDGIQDSGEPGLAGVTVNLYDCDSNFIKSTTTGSEGEYLLDALSAGDYVVEYILLPGYSFSPRFQGPGGIDSDPFPSTGQTACKALADGQSRLGFDAGMTTGTPPPTGQFGDFVWDDLNSDGIQDTGEPGLANVTVNLLDCSDNVLMSTTTGSQGEYLFDSLTAGDYVVEFILLSGYTFSPRFQGPGGSDSDPFPNTGKTACKSLADGQSRLGFDAGMTTGTPPPTGQFGDFVWDDLNSDGIQDTGEPGLSGVTVNLLDCSDNPLMSTTTGSQGEYLFDALTAGDYVVEFILLPGYSFSPRFQGPGGSDSDPFPSTGKTACKSLADGQSRLGFDAGMTTGTPPPTGQIGDFVWHDQNQDGIQDSGEPGISGATVNLLDCSQILVATTTTDGDGKFLFSNLVAGDYIVEYLLPGGFTTYSPRFAGPGGIDSDPFPTTGQTACKSLADGQSRLGLDAGMY